MSYSLEDFNRSFNGDVLNELTKQLKQLPSYNEPVEREKRYWTAEQIKTHLNLPFTSEEIENVLLELWKDNKLGKIRPAKYPHQSKLVRLWGHVDNLFSIDMHNLQQYRYDEVEFLNEFNLPEDAPNIFLSFSYINKDSAIKIRECFAKWGWNTWLYINHIPLGGKITEEVKDAISECNAAIILITAMSIGSAWIYTEFQSLTQMEKPVCAVFDISDKNLLETLSTWICGGNYSNTYSAEKVNLLVQAYLRNNGIHHLEGFKQTTEAFLSSLSFFKILALYPNRPINWQGPDKFIDFKYLKTSLLNA